MFIRDRGGNCINSESIMALDVVTDPDNVGYYVVQVNNSVNSQISTFWTGSPMTEDQANALQLQIAQLAGGYFDPTSEL